MRFFVPSTYSAEPADPMTWPRIIAVGDQLDVPGVGLVRNLHAYVLGWRFLNECEARIDCFALFVEGATCVRTGRTQGDDQLPLWIDGTPACTQGVELALAAYASTEPTLLVARAGFIAAAQLLWDGWGRDLADHAIAVGARQSEIEIRHHDEPAPSSVITRLRRDLVLPPGWETHLESHVDPFVRVRAMLEGRDALVFECCDDPWEPTCTECGGPVETINSPPWWRCEACGWP